MLNADNYRSESPPEFRPYTTSIPDNKTFTLGVPTSAHMICLVLVYLFCEPILSASQKGNKENYKIVANFVFM